MPRRSRKLIANTCLMCGKTFYSTKQADYCTENSTCRVKAYHARQKAYAVTRSLMMDMDLYALWMSVLEKRPTVVPHMQEFMANHDMKAVKDLVQIVLGLIEGTF